MKILSVGAVGVTVVLVSPSLVAQQAGTAEQAAAYSGGKIELEEVVVTAEKRTSSAQNTAIALDVFDAKTLADNGVGSIASLAAFDPSVNLGQSAGAAIVVVRGVSSRDTTEIGDPAVAVNVDGLFLQRPTGMNANFYDLQRIEVLRGPQGTLYGRNATGGVINIITQKPTDSYEGYSSVDLGNYDAVNIEGAINLPLSDTVAVRASYVSRTHDGYRDNNLGGKGDDEDDKGARLQMLYKPTDQLSILLSGNFLKQGGVGAVYDGVPLTTNAAGQITTLPPTHPSQAENFALSTKGYLDNRNVTGRAQVDYKFDAATLTYIGGYNRLDYNNEWDNDGSTRYFYNYTRHENSADLSHELRLSSNNTTGFLWQAGAYFFNEDLGLNNYFDTVPGNLPINLREYHYDVEARSYAGFGQVSYDLTDKLRASAGVRFTHDEKSRTGHAYVGSLTQNVSGGTAVRTFMLEDAHGDWSKTTWHAGLDYQVTSQNLVYAKADSGYKAGGFTDFGPYKPESLLAYEVGSKNWFLGRRLQANLDAFYYNYKDQQVTEYLLTSTGTNILNAGQSRMYGGELQTTALLTDADQVDFSAAYLHAYYKDFSVAEGPVNVQFAGNQIIQSPTWSLSAGLQHVFPVGSGTLTPRLQSQYRSSSYLQFFNLPWDRQAAYTSTDVLVTYVPPDRKWNVQGYVRNLENSVILTNADNGGPYNAVRYQFAAPRTFGARVQYNW